MDIESQMNKKIHHGHNIKRLREMLGIKQEAIAVELNITQQAVSGLEQKEEVDEPTLERIARIMNIPVEAIKNMTEDTTYNYINTFNDEVTNHNGFYNFNCSFNPIDKIVELYNDKIELYERMLKSEKEKADLFEKLLNDKK
ncbi:transcriptional regulator with XRE-family HTH domain [Dysgonomonas hofstadii]|uniref:Transcriptional regulator with XRE-family HTH domain n=1 Tax=Dysgonomonas hofstadii TaxID=637886 RepID=A0A840CTC4_9BACT|nr:helix-turn-helix transcriptional regulator [Dysgonomonas hofstadii]MBB4036924.1 transcriptional regulator with XRE-family HTH domain [Dysgonomonas hofstadii]